VSPILVRPVREQLEHDRLIRLLQVKLKRKFDAAINPGAEQHAPVGTPPAVIFPDLVLYSLERGRRLQGVIEVETGESVNHLEALAQWTHFAKLRVPFHLYVPATMVDVARRLAEDNQIVVNEIWSYHSIGDQVRFTLVHRSKEVAPPRPASSSVKPTSVKPTSAKPKAKIAAKAKPKAKPKSKPKLKPKSKKK
jgi:cell division septation protein DedD